MDLAPDWTIAPRSGHDCDASISAWYDHTTYVVPVDGTVDTSAIHTALRKKFWNPGLSGSSVGGYMSPSTITDNGDGTVMVALLYHIGD